jgi:catechol 2,3-dioxygenase-like lactoylglutathione lyase family enzyme
VTPPTDRPSPLTRRPVEIWYRVRDLETARVFYVDVLGFEEVYRDERDRWLRLARDRSELVLAEASRDAGPEDQAAAEQPVFTVEVDDVKNERERLRTSGAQVGVVVEIPGTIRLLDVFDPDGNRLQLTQEL